MRWIVTDDIYVETWRRLLEFSNMELASDEIARRHGTENTNSAIVTLNFQRPVEIGFTWPTARETLNHDTISYADAPDTHEIVDLYLVAYQLSMLSRYYPDIWVSCIESQCRGAKLIERAVEIIIKKLPILALSMLGPEEIVISTHREPWKD